MSDIVSYGVNLKQEQCSEIESRVQAALANKRSVSLSDSSVERVVIVNSPSVGEQNLIPVHLRQNLRRMSVDRHRGVGERPIDEILKQINAVDSDVCILIMRLSSGFPSFLEFLFSVDRINGKEPTLVMSGPSKKITETITEIINLGFCRVFARHKDGSEEELSQRNFMPSIDAPQELLRYSKPFFSNIRLFFPSIGKLLPFNLETLKKLYPIYGKGQVKQINLSSGIAKEMLIELPIEVINDFRFIINRPLDFYGIKYKGRDVLSKNFMNAGMERTWIKFKDINEFIISKDAATMTRLSMVNVKALEINTFTGNTRFLSGITPRNKVDLSSIQSLRILDTQAEQEVNIEHLLINDNEKTFVKEVATIIDNVFYARKLRQKIEYDFRLKNYLGELKVGAVGPMAAQILKLFRAHGLEKIIPVQNYYYLCDRPEQLPRYYRTPQRFLKHYSNFITRLDKLVNTPDDANFNIQSMYCNLPSIFEILDQQHDDQFEIAADKLESVQKELIALSKFATEEYKQNYDSEQDPLPFFESIRNFNKLSLMAKWMADYKRNAYGPAMSRNDIPDFVFFSSPAIKEINDTSVFLPGLACTEFLPKVEHQQLLARTDYDFAVFLEEEIRVAEYYCREAGNLKPTMIDYIQHIDRKINEGHQKLIQIEAKADLDADGYEEVVVEESIKYKQRYHKTVADKDKTAEQIATLRQELLEFVPQYNFQSKHKPQDLDYFLELQEHVEKLCLSKTAQLMVSITEDYQLYQDLFNQCLARLASFDDARIKLHLWIIKHHNVLSAQGKHAAMRSASHRVEGFKKLPQPALKELQHQIIEQLAKVRDFQTNLEKKIQIKTNWHEKQATFIVKTIERTIKILGEASGASSLAPRQQFDKKLVTFNSLIEITDFITKMTTAAHQHNVLFQRFQQQKENASTQIFTLENDLTFLKRAIDDYSSESVAPPAVQLTTDPTEGKILRQNFDLEKSKLVNVVKKIKSKLTVTKMLHADIEKKIEHYHSEITTLKDLMRKLQRNTLAQKYITKQELAMQSTISDLNTQIKERFVPAQKRIATDIELPEIIRMNRNYSLAKDILQTLHYTNIEHIDELLIKNSIFERFFVNQFLKGVAISPDLNASGSAGWQNVTQAITLFFKRIDREYKNKLPQNALRLKFERHGYLPPRGMINAVTRWAGYPEENRPYTYALLPSSYSIEEALDVMRKKDFVYSGMPQMVFIYISPEKNMAEKHYDSYRTLLKRNIIIHIDGSNVVDNAQSIADALWNNSLNFTRQFRN